MSNTTNQEVEDCIRNTLADMFNDVAIDILKLQFDKHRYNGVTLGMIVEYRKGHQCKSIDDVALLIINRVSPAPDDRLREFTITQLNDTLANVGKTFDTLTMDDVKQQEANAPVKKEEEEAGKCEG